VDVSDLLSAAAARDEWLHHVALDGAGADKGNAGYYVFDVDDLIEFLKVELLGVVPDDESIIISTNRGVPAVMEERSRAGQAFRDIAARIMGNDVPIAAMLEPDDWLGRFAKWLGISRG
jgi:septum formation inhibitor-activating ATPase MinD